MSAREPCGRVDPALGRVSGAVAVARFHGDAWLSTADRCITTALEAAAPNTRIAWACDSGHLLRVGAAQDLAAAGVSTAGILQTGGRKDARMIRRSLRKLRAGEGGMAQYFSAGSSA